MTLELRVTEVLAGFTVSASSEELLPLNCESPEYDAEITCVPVVKDVRTTCALPPETVTVPSVVEPSVKVMVPDGLLPEEG